MTKTLYCERCHKPLGPEVLACPGRETGACPYYVVRSKLLKSNLAVWAFLVIGLGLIVLPSLALLLTRAFKFIFIPLVGVLLVAIGLCASVAKRVTVYHQETGQMWEKTSIWGITLSQCQASAFKPIPFHTSEIRGLQYPPSVSALYPLIRGQQKLYNKSLAADIVYVTILSLVGQGHLSLLRTTKFTKNKSEQFFILAPQDRSPGPIDGELESRIVSAVAEWSQRTDSSISGGNTVFARKLRHCLVIHDVLPLVLKGKWASPSAQLVTYVIGPEVVKAGLGDIKGGVQKKLDFAPEAAALLQTDYEVVNHAVKKFTATYSGLESKLRAQILEAVRFCVDMD